MAFAEVVLPDVLGLAPVCYPTFIITASPNLIINLFGKLADCGGELQQSAKRTLRVSKLDGLYRRH